MPTVLRASPREARPTEAPMMTRFRPVLRDASILAATLALSACAGVAPELARSPSLIHQAPPPVTAVLESSTDGQQGVFPVQISNAALENKTVEDVTYELSLDGRPVTQGSQQVGKQIAKGQSMTVKVVIDIDDAWLRAAPDASRDGELPFTLRGQAQVGAVKRPFDVAGTLRVPRPAAAPRPASAPAS